MSNARLVLEGSWCLPQNIPRSRKEYPEGHTMSRVGGDPQRPHVQLLGTSALAGSSRGRPPSSRGAEPACGRSLSALALHKPGFVKAFKLLKVSKHRSALPPGVRLRTGHKPRVTHGVTAVTPLPWLPRAPAGPEGRARGARRRLAPLHACGVAPPAARGPCTEVASRCWWWRGAGGAPTGQRWGKTPLSGCPRARRCRRAPGSLRTLLQGRRWRGGRGAPRAGGAPCVGRRQKLAFLLWRHVARRSESS